MTVADMDFLIYVLALLACVAFEWPHKEPTQ